MNYIFYILFFAILFTSCKDKESSGDTLSGKLKVVSDDSFLDLTKAEQKVFQYLYKNADLTLTAAPEADAVKDFVEGEADMIVVGRDLSEKEKQKLAKKNIYPQSFVIASDGLALIIHKDRQDSSIALPLLTSIMKGEVTHWKELGSKKGEEIELVFDYTNSSTILYINQKLGINTQKVNAFAAGSNLKVIEYIKNHPDAIGIISVSWLSDDVSTNEHLKNLNVLAIDGYHAWQEDLSTGKYPLKRDIFLINKYKSGLGTGFASFILSEDGQRIVLKAGLLPAKMPGREVILN